MLRSAKYGLYGAVLAGIVGGGALGGSALSHASDKSVTLVVDGRSSSVDTTAANVSGVLTQVGYHAGSHDLLAPTASSSVHDGSTIVYKRARLLKLSVDGTTREIWTTAPTVAAAMDQLGYTTANFTSVSRSKRLPLGTTDIAIRTPKAVTVTHDGEARTLTTTDATVGDLLDDLGVSLGTNDRLSPADSTPLADGMDIAVQRVVKKTTTTSTPVPFTTVHKPDESLPAGAIKILSHGKPGAIRSTYADVYVDGKLAGRTLVSRSVASKPVPQVEAVGVGAGASTSPGSAQAIARVLAEQRGWGADQFSCLVTMWNHESGWRVNAANPSGAYGIPQSLPGSKMASAGPDWQSNPTTQIKWGLQYIASRYGTPCGAWSTWQAHGGWY